MDQIQKTKTNSYKLWITVLKFDDCTILGFNIPYFSCMHCKKLLNVQILKPAK